MPPHLPLKSSLFYLYKTCSFTGIVLPPFPLLEEGGWGGEGRLPPLPLLGEGGWGGEGRGRAEAGP